MESLKNQYSNDLLHKLTNDVNNYEKAQNELDLLLRLYKVNELEMCKQLKISRKTLWNWKNKETVIRPIDFHRILEYIKVNYGV
jgi:transcriptional regulator with PAS, ATPase and Fis domain